MIKIDNLNKSYGKTQVLNNINMQIPNGVYGLLGENGAGKSTLMKILTTTIGFDSGDIEIFGIDLKKNPEEVRRLIGYLPQDFDFFPNCTVFEAIDYLAGLKKLPKGREREQEIISLLKRFKLVEHKDKKVKVLSGGMKQRLGIIQSLLGDPKVIILDEPTSGLDPMQRLYFRNTINELGEDRVVILSTHIISDISSSCENMGILHNGTLLYNGEIETLLEEIKNQVYVMQITSDQLTNIGENAQILSIQRKAKNLMVRFMSDNINLKQHAQVVEPVLEDAYFYRSYMCRREPV